MKRPLLLVGLLYVGGIIAAEYLPLSPYWLLVSLGILVLLALCCSGARPVLLYPIIVWAGCTNLVLEQTVLSPNDLRKLLGPDTELVTIRGVLLETPVVRKHETDDRSFWHTQAKLAVSALRPNKSEWRPARGRIVISSSGELTNLFAGQTIEVTGAIAPPPRAVADGLFDYRSYLARLNYYFQLTANSEKDWQLLASPRSPPLADRFRSWGRMALALGLPFEDEALRLEWALTLGWKPALTEEVSEPFIRASTYHIFAVDGLRMAIVFGIFFGVLRAFSVPRSIIGLVLLPVIWFYVALTGWPASAIRASVMLTIVILGWIIHRPGELINSLFAAALLILLWQPQQLFQAGFQLSFFVVLCIILTVPVLNKAAERIFAPGPLLPKALHRRWPAWLRVPARYVWDVLIVSFAAWIGSLPLAAYYFNIVTPISTPANLVAVPLCALVLMSNLASLLLASWFPAAAILFNHAGWWLMECIHRTTNWFAAWPKAYAYVAAPTFFTSALFYAVLIAVVTGWLFKPRFRRVKIGGLSLLLACWVFQCVEQLSILRLTILPLNGSTAIFFDPPRTRRDLLIDCGREQSVQSIVKPFLRAQGVDGLAGFLVTHGEARRMAGAQRLTTIFPINHIYASAAPSRSPDYKHFIELCQARPGQVVTVQREDKLRAWTVLHPDRADHFSQGDDNAVVLSGEIRGTRVLLLSDLGRPGQNALLERYPSLRADILVSGLPNRGEALSDSLLQAVQPKVIIITDSPFPVQQRASHALKQRLAQNHFRTFYTRETGAVTIDFENNSWKLRTMSGARLSSADGRPFATAVIDQSPDAITER